MRFAAPAEATRRIGELEAGRLEDWRSGNVYWGLFDGAWGRSEGLPRLLQLSESGPRGGVGKGNLRMGDLEMCIGGCFMVPGGGPRDFRDCCSSASQGHGEG